MEIPGYTIEDRIGKGGMATVYLATQSSLDRQVVLKVLNASAIDSPAVLERFINEGRLVASLQHPNIITTYDIGTADDEVYISMEYVEGGDLKQKLKDNIFSPSEAVNIVEKIGSGLGAAHAKGIIHRDVKPGNILFREDGTPLLSDFGIAKRLSGDAELTRTGMFVGSPNYMAPEQSDLGPIDQRADIYSLGVIFYEMLTGKKPYIASSVIDVILKHKNAPIPRLAPALRPYQEMIELMLAKDRGDRFQDVPSLLHYIFTKVDVPDPAVTTRASQDGSRVLSSEDKTIEAGQVTRLSLEPNKRRDYRVVLSAAAIVCAFAYAGLLVIERRMQGTDLPTSVPVGISIDIPLNPTPSPNSGEAMSAIEREKITGALRWLASHSLNEYRLTAPPKDNAYYYYSRLLQMDPADPTARAGLMQIAERFAILAEREIAKGNREQAQRYIEIGLQIDASNKTLAALRGLAQLERRGFFDSIKSFFE